MSQYADMWRLDLYPSSDFAGYYVASMPRSIAQPMIMEHYLHRWPGVCVLTLGMYNPAPSGVIVFALPPRETPKRYKVNIAWELARLWVHDSEPFNSETWFMSKAIKYVKKHNPEVDLLVSYADPSAGHNGMIYRAGNWKQDGRTDQERKTPRFDYVVAGKMYSRRSHVPEGSAIERVPRVSKNRFIYALNRKSNG